ncbi:MAG: hypothetical protein O9262_06875, partial [Cyclobacteriaceae bacterium]|nr:hypothetical protein [Cyclobacteriaceae bacterium]
MKQALLFLLLILFAIPVAAQQNTALDKLAEQHALASIPEFYDLLSLPNVASQHDDIEKNVVWCEPLCGKTSFRKCLLAP